MANILLLYNETQTYTQTLYEYLQAFTKYSKHNYYFAHVSGSSECLTNVGIFDAVAIHYSIRLPFDQFSRSWHKAIQEFAGKKFLFIQDEYDHTMRAWYWIKELGIDTVFTCVPERNISKIYPGAEFPGVKFHNVLTGYVPMHLPDARKFKPTAKRQTLIGYRGRALPAKYGELGAQKLGIGKMVKSYAKSNNHSVNIEWDDSKRIYGKKWYDFVASTRATLGTESGANIFDWNGDINQKLSTARIDHPEKSDHEIIRDVLKIPDEDGLMNQISPRAFEAIALNTVLVLYRGDYSGVLLPDVHYVVLEKDGSNLGQVFDILNDVKHLEEISGRAYNDIIASGAYSYEKYIKYVDEKVDLNTDQKIVDAESAGAHTSPRQHVLIQFPKRKDIQTLEDLAKFVRGLFRREHIRAIVMTIVFKTSKVTPKPIRDAIKPLARRILGL